MLVTGCFLLFALALVWKAIAMILPPLLKIAAVFLCIIAILAVILAAVGFEPTTPAIETKNTDGSVSVSLD
jgi:uncharacterized membrane protein YidH (DUF202 family)